MKKHIFHLTHTVIVAVLIVAAALTIVYVLRVQDLLQDMMLSSKGREMMKEAPMRK